MFSNNRRYITENETRDDYICLDLRLNSPHPIWIRAIEIMRNRIVGRYIDPMNTLVEKEPNKNGFAAMALCSLLIEVLMQFREGLPQGEHYQNRNMYSLFLQVQLSNSFDTHTANRFYKGIRCGILHSAQTTNNCCLTFGTDYTVRLQGNDVMMVDVQNTITRIEEYFDRYCDELMDASNVQLRTNFIRKMNDISKVLDGSEVMDNLWFALCEKEKREIQVKNRIFFIDTVTNYNITLREQMRGHTMTVRITKEEIEDALYYWPYEKAILMLKNGKYIIPLIQLCENVADELNSYQILRNA